MTGQSKNQRTYRRECTNEKTNERPLFLPNEERNAKGAQKRSEKESKDGKAANEGYVGTLKKKYANFSPKKEERAQKGPEVMPTTTARTIIVHTKNSFICVRGECTLHIMNL